MKEYFLSKVAIQDIDEIIDYIAEENQQVALHLLDSLFESLDMLASNPKIGHLREDLTNKDVRFWPFKWHYLIIYKTCSPY